MLHIPDHLDSIRKTKLRQFLEDSFLVRRMLVFGQLRKGFDPITDTGYCLDNPTLLFKE